MLFTPRLFTQDEARCAGERAGGWRWNQQRVSGDSQTLPQAEEGERSGGGSGPLGVSATGDPAPHLPVPASAGSSLRFSGTWGITGTGHCTTTAFTIVKKEKQAPISNKGFLFLFSPALYFVGTQSGLTMSWINTRTTLGLFQQVWHLCQGEGLSPRGEWLVCILSSESHFVSLSREFEKRLLAQPPHWKVILVQ